MSKVIGPAYTHNRAANQAYGCGCVCNDMLNNHDAAENSASAEGDVCGCTCNGMVNGIANRDLAYDYQIYSF